MGPMNHRLPLLEALESRQLLSAGQLDPSFGHGGKVLTDLGLSFGNGVAIQADGKIVASAGPDLVLYRLTASGQLDSTFGVGGKAVTDLGLAERPRDIAIQADGKIVVSIDGHIVLTQNGSTSWPSYQTYLVRFNA